MSDLYAIAREIATVFEENNKAHGIAGNTVLFSDLDIVEGTVMVHAVDRVEVAYVSIYGDLPYPDTRVFSSGEDARRFLWLAFIENNFTGALAVPCEIAVVANG